MSQVILHDNKVVPYVTMWSAEQEQLHANGGAPTQASTRPYLLAGGKTLNLQHEPQARGMGEPLWANVASRRFHECLFQNKCQVCGSPVGREDPLWGILARDAGVDLSEVLKAGMSIWGAEAPVCEPCAVDSMRLCPHLREAERLWIRGHFNGVVAAIGGMSHLAADGIIAVADIPDHFIVKQLVVNIAVTEVVGKNPVPR